MANETKNTRTSKASIGDLLVKLMQVCPEDNAGAIKLKLMQIQDAESSLKSLVGSVFIAVPTFCWLVADFASLLYLVIGSCFLFLGSFLTILKKKTDHTRAGQTQYDVRKQGWQLIFHAWLPALGWSIIIASSCAQASTDMLVLLLCYQLSLICICAIMYIHFPPAFSAVSVTFMVAMAFNLKVIGGLAGQFSILMVCVMAFILLKFCLDRTATFLNSATQGERLIAIENERFAESGRKLQLEQEAERDRLELENATQQQQAENARALFEREQAQAQERRQLMFELANAFEATVVSVAEDLSDSVTTLNVSARSLTHVSSSVAETSAKTMKRAQNASEASGSVAASVTELVNSISEISNRVKDHAEVSDRAMSLTQSNRHVIEALAAEADRMRDIIDLIENVTSQTNLLALNATIEAARAGEAGRGFAVVASEVKKLASEAQSATARISEHISKMHARVADASNTVGKTEAEISGIAQIAGTISVAVVQQRSTTDEIGQNAVAAADNAETLYSEINSISHISEEVSALTDDVSKTAQNVSIQSEKLKRSAASFLEKLRAA